MIHIKLASDIERSHNSITLEDLVEDLELNKLLLFLTRKRKKGNPGHPTPHNIILAWLDDKEQADVRERLRRYSVIKPYAAWIIEWALASKGLL